MAKKTRDLGTEILQGLQEIKRGEYGRVINVPDVSKTCWEEFRRRRQLWVRFALTMPLFFLYGLALAVLQPDPHGVLAMVLIGPMFVVMPAWFVTYVVLCSRVLNWRCPKCGDRFCSSWLIRWPWVSRCVHCGERVADKPAEPITTVDRPCD